LTTPLLGDSLHVYVQSGDPGTCAAYAPRAA
jgi:hypothetical protein